MKLSCASWSFPHLTLRESVHLAKTLGVHGLDLGLLYRGGLDREALLTTPEVLAASLAGHSFFFPCYFHLFGNSLHDQNCADPGARQSNLQEFERVAIFCEAAGIGTIFISPGVVNAGQTLSSSLDESARTIELLVRAADNRNIALTIEPHIKSNVESPNAALKLLQLCDGLSLTLDYSHLICLGYRQEEIDLLIPFAAHVHLRQARPGRAQERLDLGTINFPALIARLREHGYDGYLTLEYCYQDFLNMKNVDVLSETVRMRDLVVSCFDQR